jgi:hypothetical protein
VLDCANIKVIWHPDNLVPDKGSRFREGGIKGDQDVLIERPRCTSDGLAPTTLANRHGETGSAIVRRLGSGLEKPLLTPDLF